MEFFVPETDNPEDGDMRICNLELWNSLSGPLGNPPSADFDFKREQDHVLQKALDNLHY